jgi:hypothetical protein
MNFINLFLNYYIIRIRCQFSNYQIKNERFTAEARTKTQ